MSLSHMSASFLTLNMLVTTIDALPKDTLKWNITAQWEGMEDVGSAKVRASTTFPMPDHKDFNPPTPFLSEFSDI